MATIVYSTPPTLAEPASWPLDWTIADLKAGFDDIPLERIIAKPFPGTATEEDLLRLDAENLFAELIDGVLVRKTVGFLESRLAVEIAFLVAEFVRQHNLGIMTGTDGPYRLMPGNVRYPDFAFTSWNSLPGGKLPDAPIAPMAPDLVIEVLSQSNTKKEMDRKLRDYFAAGVKLVWYVDPKSKTAQIYRGVKESVAVDERGELSGEPVLPGFKVRLGEVFERVNRQPPKQ